MAQDKTVHRGRLADAPLALYGAGSLGHMAREYLERIGIPIRFVVDANARQLRQAPYWAGIQLLAPDEVTADKKQDTLLALCVVTAPYAPIAEQLNRSGWRDIVPFYDIADRYLDQHPLSNGWFAPPFSEQEQEFISAALGVWSDDTSRAHHLQFIAWRRLREEWTFRAAPINISNRFFIPEVLAALSKTECFLDAGAYLGQVTQAFIQHMGGHFKTIWALEPDSQSRQKLQGNIAELEETQRRKISVLPHLLGSENMERSFFGGLGYASQCSLLGREQLPCRTIDSLDISPSFIKLHLEGMELQALQGATDTLKQHRPVIVATIYHNDDGLWRTPLWLKGNLPDYTLLLRLHSWCGTGATIYAIPNERWNHSQAT